MVPTDDNWSNSFDDIHVGLTPDAGVAIIQFVFLSGSKNFRKFQLNKQWSVSYGKYHITGMSCLLTRCRSPPLSSLISGVQYTGTWRRRWSVVSEWTLAVPVRTMSSLLSSWLYIIAQVSTPEKRWEYHDKSSKVKSVLSSPICHVWGVTTQDAYSS